jgi:hypothetical protein
MGRALGAVLVVAMAPASARAADAFEIQVYDGSADAPGQASLEAHLNYVAAGLTAASPPELPSNHQAHFTLEPAYGVLPFWEIGAYLLTALQPNGDYDFVGGKLRSKLVTPPGLWTHAHLGVNVEVSYARAAWEPERTTAEVRPIAAWWGRWVTAAVNPNIGLSLRSGDPSFEPAATVVVRVRDVASFGLEYYGDLGPILDPLPLREQQHYLYEVANLLAVRNFELNLGVGEGLTAASNAVVAKAIVGVAF